MIREKSEESERVIDLTGPQGNAGFLIGQARRWLRELGREDDVDAITREMMGGDYENVIQVFDREFGSFCILER